MVRSLWSGVAGLKTHQLQMDVIGNNVSNVNTTSYKSQRTTFGDLLYQTNRRANGPSAIRGGTNAKQIGLGAKTSAIMTNIAKQGSIQTTDAPFDISITGDSFFVIENANGEMCYSRDGSFTVDAEGYLVTRGNGYYVRGISEADAEATALSRIQVIPINEEGVVERMAGEATTYARVTGNIAKVDPLLDPEKGRTLDLEFYGTDGNTYTMRLRFTDAGDNDDRTYTATITNIYDSNHRTIQGGVPEENTVNLTFDPVNGSFVSANGAENGQITVAFQGDAADAGTLTVDFSQMTSFAPMGDSTSSALYAYRGDDQGNFEGYPEGKMVGVSVGQDGTVTRLFSNGKTQFAGRIVVAEFANATGLSKEGENLYKATGNSGDAQLMFVNDDGGYMTAGTLEMSNVDLSTEFTNMIITQRGFQANSRVITVTDTLLDELRQLKR
ncbi:MAG: flagellar hook protein FlgE [Butyrivibrio sp.]|nr:flagellar hook protein FlgE [Butyrivibrio sp.]